MALKNQPYIPLYVMDFVTDEKLEQCSAESTGVYIRLMCYLHKGEPYGTIKLNHRCLHEGEDIITGFARMLSRPMPYDMEIIDRALRELIDMGVVTLDGDTLYQKRMVRDGQQSKVRSDAGAKGGKANHKQTPSKSESDSQANSKQNTEIESEVEIEAENEIESDDKKSESAAEFDAFWAVYPRKENKSGAKKSWRRLSPDAALTARIMASLERAKECEQWRRDGGRYIPHAATWLNNARWEDAYAPPDIAQDRSADHEAALRDSDAWMDAYLAGLKGGAQNDNAQVH